MISLLVAARGPLERRVVQAADASARISVVRRCGDIAELLSAAAAQVASVAIVSADLPALERSLLADLQAHGVAVVGLYDASSTTQELMLRQLGITTLLADTDMAAVEESVQEAHDRAASVDDAEAGPARPAEDIPEEGSPASAPALDLAVGNGGIGRIVAVWGPSGAPGRSLVALTLASEAAGFGVPSLIVDADPYGGCQAQQLALLNEAPGLAAAIRAGDQGSLDLFELARLSPEALPGLRILSGLPKAERWPELRPAPLEQVLHLCRSLAEFIVVDCGFSLEDDEVLSYDTMAPRRNAATLTVLENADEVVVVGSADPIGLQRLVRGLEELGRVRAPGARTVVVNRVRASAVGANPGARIAESLERFAGIAEPVLVPEDREAVDGALLAGLTLGEHAPSSPAREALRAVTAALAQVSSPAPLKRHRLIRA